MRYFLVGIVLFAASASASEYYVDAVSGNDTRNSGSHRSPWRTISKVLRTKLLPGDVIHVAPGNYPEQVLVTYSGTPAAHIRFVCASPKRCFVTGRKYNASFGPAVFLLIGSYIDVNGFDISDGDGTGAYGVEGYGAMGNYRIEGNFVHDIPIPACDANGGTGIGPEATGQGGHSYIAGNIITRIGYASQCGRANGIYLAGDGSIVANNVVYDMWGSGIDIAHRAQNVIVAFNTVDGIRRGHGIGGAGFYMGCDLSECNNNHVVNNLSTNSYAPVFINQPGRGNIIDHNLFHGNLANKCRGVIFSRCTNTVTANPYYANRSRGDFHLSPMSAAIGAASSQHAPMVDADGRPRPYRKGGTFDIGAYSFSGTPGSLRHLHLK